LFGKLIDVGIVAILGTFLAVSILLSFARDIVPDIILDRRDPTLLLAPFVASFLTLLLSYRFLPTVRTYVRDLWPAALGGAMAFEVLKFGFGVYLDLFSRNDVIYGSLGIVIGFMVFVYLSAALLLAGAELASETPRVRAGTYDEPAGERVSLTERIRRKLRVKRRNTSGGESPSSTDGRREPPAQS
jgi:YihY family inner membrane protein